MPASPRARALVVPALVVPALALSALALRPSAAAAAVWKEVTAETIGPTAEWSNKVELADIDGDGDVDILFANGRGYASDAGPELNRVFLNQGAGQAFVEASAEVMGDPDRTRVIKARDVDGDGAVDLFIGNTWQTQSRLLLGDGAGGFEEVTATHLPQQDASFGDAELGDVDGDGDFDLVLVDWGPGDASQNAGGRVRLWKNDGGGVFTDASAAVPADLVRWSWELELIDVDDDLDLDILVSCKSCDGSFLFLGDGAGAFTDASAWVPQFPNNYDFEAIDLTGDGLVEVVTINDKQPGTREHVFSWHAGAGFVDVTDQLLPMDQNLAGDDNMVVYLDAESDGDADVLIAGLGGSPDRLLLNDGTGKLSVQTSVFAPADSPGTLGVAVADLNGDHRLDVVMAEGEIAEPDRVFFGEDLPVDTGKPRVIDRGARPSATPGAFVVTARVHDHKTPVMPHDFQEVVVEQVLGDMSQKTSMLWYGDNLWRAEVTPLGPGALARVCATDAAGNQACDDAHALGEDSETTGGSTDGGATDSAASSSSGPTTDGSSGGAGSTSATDGATGGPGGDDDGGCGCRSGDADAPPPAIALALALTLALAAPARRRPR